MSTYTTNYNLEKPDSTDDFKDFRSNYNSNMDIIDANLGGGGGGGNVDDVLVNGVSVVDGNHDAQITSYKEVTQAEYDALPATKLTDGIAYFIKDAGGGGGGSSSHDYSTTEQVVGTWIDGKPLYEITLQNNSTNVTGSNVLIDVASLDIDTCVSLHGMCDRIVQNVGTLIYDMNSWETSQLYTCLAYSQFNQKIQYQIRFYNNEATSWQNITVQYTKTSD